MLGVAGGIAAYKAIDVCRRLVDAGVHVMPVLTEDAQRFVGALTFSALASEPARTSLFDGPGADPAHASRPDRRPRRRRAGHRQAHRQVHGGHLRRPPHRDAARDPGAGARLPGDAHRDVGARRGAGEPGDPAPPGRARARAGSRAASPGGDVGTGRLADPERIVARVLELLAARAPRAAGAGVLSGRSVLVTAGGTREPIDPVRYVGNRSSGKMGHAIASAARRQGARVVLVTTADQPVAAGIEVVRVETAEEMRDAVRRPRRRRPTPWSWPPRSPTSGPRRSAHREDQEGRRRARDRARAHRRHPRRARGAQARRARSSSASRPRPSACRSTRRPSSRRRRSTSWSPTT